MPRKKPGPGHPVTTRGGARPGAGRPATTASSTTRPICFRLGAEDYAALELASGELSVGQRAKAFVLANLKT